MDLQIKVVWLGWVQIHIYNVTKIRRQNSYWMDQPTCVREA